MARCARRITLVMVKKHQVDELTFLMDFNLGRTSQPLTGVTLKGLLRTRAAWTKEGLGQKLEPGLQTHLFPGHERLGAPLWLQPTQALIALTINGKRAVTSIAPKV